MRETQWRKFGWHNQFLALNRVLNDFRKNLDDFRLKMAEACLALLRGFLGNAVHPYDQLGLKAIRVQPQEQLRGNCDGRKAFPRMTRIARRTSKENHAFPKEVN